MQSATTVAGGEGSNGVNSPVATECGRKRIVGGHIEIGHVLGSGGFGKVYFAYDLKRKRKVAVKMISKELVRAHGIQAYVEREIEMMRKIKNAHIIALLEAIETSRAYNLVMELAPNGELFDKIVDSQRFDEKTARNYFQQLIDAVHYCHKINIVHRDLKAENLLLGENNVLKVCDFGLSRYIHEGRTSDTEVLFTSLAGSVDYQAPEVLKECGYEGSTCDMWSCGCILFFMLCGYLPFTDRSDGLTRKRILSCQYNRRNRYLSDGAADLIEHLLDRDPATRYTTADVIRHPWFQTDLDPLLFPQDSTKLSPQSPVVSGEFIQRAFTPQNSQSLANPSLSPTMQTADELHQAFLSCNITGDGFLSKEEVRDALIKLNDNKPISDDEVAEFMQNFQLDAEGRITEEEFVVGWTKHQNKLGQKYDLGRMVNLFHYDLEKEFLHELRDTFDSIDTEHSGVITVENIRKLGLGLTDGEIQGVFSAIEDETHSGEIPALTFERFVQLCLKYDLLKNRPLARRLRRLEKFFTITEHTSFKSYLNTGYTVAGPREVIKALLLAQSATLQTAFDADGIDGFLYGTHCDAEGKKVLEVGVRLLPASPGYTKVIPYRIRGKTSDFHVWFLHLRRAMKEQLLRCEEDTAIKGQPELM